MFTVARLKILNEIDRLTLLRLASSRDAHMIATLHGFGPSENESGEHGLFPEL